MGQCSLRYSGGPWSENVEEPCLKPKCWTFRACQGWMCISFFHFYLVRKTAPKRRWGTTKWKGQSQTQVSPNDQRSPLERRKRRRRKQTRQSVGKWRAQAAVMTAVMIKTSWKEKRVKVDIKTKNLPKREGEMKTAAQGKVMMKRKVKDGLIDAKSESRPLTKTQTQGHTHKKRGKTGKQQVRVARLIVLLTEIHRRGWTHSSGKDQQSTADSFVIFPITEGFSLQGRALFRTVLDINKPELSALSVGVQCSDSSSTSAVAWSAAVQTASRGMVGYPAPGPGRILSAAGSLIDHWLLPQSVCIMRRPPCP